MMTIPSNGSPPGVIPQKDSLQDLPGEVCAGWYQNFHQGKPIIIKDIENIRDSQPVLYETLKRQDVRTLVVVPLYDGEMVIGFYGVDNPPLEYLTISTNILQLMGYFIVSNIRRRDLRLRLERASYLDELTGLGNRRAFIKRAAVCEEIQQIGCVVLDINNLKLCNDRYGHLAGDDLIRESAACIREAFEELGDCYRVGGDEFYVLLYGKNQSQIAEAVERLNQIVANKKADSATLISLAYGWGLRDSGETMEHLVNRCDERMYDMKYRMKEEYSTYRKERMQTYLSILEFLSSSTNDYLFLLDIPRDENRFFGGIDRYYAIREPGKRTNTTKQLLNIVHPDDRTAFMEDLQKAMNGASQALNMNYRWVNRQGETVWISCSGMVIQDHKGKPFVIIGRVSETNPNNKI